MNLLFWNINSPYNGTKEKWMDDIINETSPDIFCVAEGSDGTKDCELMLAFMKSKGYNVYYSPTFYSGKENSNEYGWNKFGLKVFVKKDLKLRSRFTFTNQKLEGRIIYIRLEINSIFYSIYLVHGKSKVGDDIDQKDFIIELSHFIRDKNIADKEYDKIMILGDFNIEPWEDVLNKKKYIYSFFNNKSYQYFEPKTSALRKIYSNPIFDYMLEHKDKNLIGTFYNKNYVGVLDFPLFSRDFTNYELKVFTEINNKKLMINNKNKNHTLVDGFDHLPISINIT